MVGMVIRSSKFLCCVIDDMGNFFPNSIIEPEEFRVVPFRNELSQIGGLQCNTFLQVPLVPEEGLIVLRDSPGTPPLQADEVF